MRWQQPSGLILLYHRIIQLTSDPQMLAVAPGRFAQHLEILRRDYHPMSIQEMAAAARDRQLPDRAVAVTCDDGYADNLEWGKPLLERHGIPATVFVAAGYVGGDREFWWDDLERLLLLPGRLPDPLRLKVGPMVHEWRLGEAAVHSEQDYGRSVDWHVECADDPSPRHRAYRDLCRLLRAVTAEERVATLDALSALAGVTSAGRATHRVLSRDDLVRLADGGVADVGAHTMTHSMLSALPVGAQHHEILDSKTRLQEITGREVTSFAYPFGGRADYTSATVGLVRNAGFAVACANRARLVRRRSDSWQLPRVLVRNWAAGKFASFLHEWFGG